MTRLLDLLRKPDPSHQIVNQGLGIIFRAYTACKWKELNIAEREALASRAKTMISLGYAILAKLEGKL